MRRGVLRRVGEALSRVMWIYFGLIVLLFLTPVLLVLTFLTVVLKVDLDRYFEMNLPAIFRGDP